MQTRRILGPTIVSALALALTGVAGAAEPVTGEKLDNDLGNLPPYVQWHRHPELAGLAGRDAVPNPAAKIDSGLGSLPPYAEWRRDPELSRLVEAADRNAVSLKMTPAAEQIAGVRD